MYYNSIREFGTYQLRIEMKRSWSNVLFGIDEELLKSKSSYNTAKEILQQPKLWKETLENFKKTKNNLEEYLKKIGLNEEFQVIFTGAGTSEYIGNILELFLKKNSNLEFKSIGTTEILNNPSNYLKKNRKNGGTQYVKHRTTRTRDPGNHGDTHGHAALGHRECVGKNRCRVSHQQRAADALDDAPGD